MTTRFHKAAGGPSAPPPIPPGLLTVWEVAARAGCCHRTVKRAVQAKRLPVAARDHARCGAKLFDPAAVDAWATAPQPQVVTPNRVKPPEPADCPCGCGRPFQSRPAASA